jgi:molybdopterin-binding protein
MIRSSNFFWGGILILLGGLFLVDSLGIMEINLWGVFWPLMLILFGLWVLLGYFKRGSPVEAEESAIPLEGARKATIHLNHGAGRLVLRSGAGPMELISGSFGGGLSTKTRLDGDSLDVTMRIREGGFPHIVFPWFWGPHAYLDWDLQLTDEIPLDIRLNTGASDTRLDLTDLQVTNLRIETGASATEIQLPDGVAYTKVIVKAGAASVNLKVPENVAARVRVSGGLMGATVDRERFPKSGGTYQSLDYEIALHKVEIYANVGVGSVTVR